MVLNDLSALTRMKRCIIILTIGLLIPSLVALSPLASSPYTDDSYYWPVVDTLVSSQQPVYDKNMREFIFLEDTTQYPDTVVMRIVEN